MALEPMSSPRGYTKIELISPDPSAVIEGLIRLAEQEGVDHSTGHASYRFTY